MSSNGQNENLAPWSLPPTLAQLFAPAVTPRIERTESIDDPIASAIIDSLYFELADAYALVKYLRQELRKARGDE